MVVPKSMGKIEVQVWQCPGKLSTRKDNLDTHLFIFSLCYMTLYMFSIMSCMGVNCTENNVVMGLCVSILCFIISAMPEYCHVMHFKSSGHCFVRHFWAGWHHVCVACAAIPSTENPLFSLKTKQHCVQ